MGNIIKNQEADKQTETNQFDGALKGRLYQFSSSKSNSLCLKVCLLRCPDNSIVVIWVDENGSDRKEH